MSTRFALFVYDDVEPIDVGAAFGVLSIARRLLPELEFFLVARAPGDVTLTGGLVVRVDCGFAQCPDVDVLMVLGGPGWQTQSSDPDTLAFLQRMSTSCVVASVCTGGMILAAAGLLDGRRATTRRIGIAGETVPLELMRQRYSRTTPVEALIVDDGAVVTGGGVSLGIDTTLYLLERFFGSARIGEVARLLEYTSARAANAASLATVSNRQ